MERQAEPREIELSHHSSHPSKAELEEEFHMDASFEEVVAACMRPVKITHAAKAEALDVVASPLSCMIPNPDAMLTSLVRYRR